MQPTKEQVVTKLKSYGHTNQQIDAWFKILESPEVGVRNMDDLAALVADYDIFKSLELSPMAKLSIRKAFGYDDTSIAHMKFDEKTENVMKQVLDLMNNNKDTQ